MNGFKVKDLIGLLKKKLKEKKFLFLKSKNLLLMHETNIQIFFIYEINIEISINSEIFLFFQEF